MFRMLVIFAFAFKDDKEYVSYNIKTMRINVTIGYEININWSSVNLLKAVPSHLYFFAYFMAFHKHVPFSTLAWCYLEENRIGYQI